MECLFVLVLLNVTRTVEFSLSATKKIQNPQTKKITEREREKPQYRTEPNPPLVGAQQKRKRKSNDSISGSADNKSGIELHLIGPNQNQFLMTQQQPSLPLPPPPFASVGGLTGGVQVRCAGCHRVLTVAPGVTEFKCPDAHCKLAQMLPPELMTRAHHNHKVLLPPPPPPPPLPLPPLPPNVPAHGIDPTKIQLPCAHCKAILNVPHGLARFVCPQCGVDLAVDVSKLRQFFPPLPPPPPEEVNEVTSYFCFRSFSIFCTFPGQL